jgi:hypothetical protein
MTMVAGTVAVDANGTETYTPNDATNAAKSLYALLIIENASGTMKQKVSGGKAIVNHDGTVTPPPPPTYVSVPFTITPTPDFKQKQAALANLMASWMVTYILANAVISVTIPATSGGDGLQTSTTVGTQTTHPSSPKTLGGTLT